MAILCTWATEKLQFDNFFLSILQDTSKNYWTNTRLVCIHFNAFFFLNPNLAMKMRFLKFMKKVWKLLHVVCIRHLRARRGLIKIGLYLSELSRWLSDMPWIMGKEINFWCLKESELLLWNCYRPFKLWVCEQWCVRNFATFSLIKKNVNLKKVCANIISKCMTNLLLFLIIMKILQNWLNCGFLTLSIYTCMYNASPNRSCLVLGKVRALCTN